MSRPFHKLFCVAFFTCLLNNSCKKSDSDRPVTYIHSKVLEYKTGTPIARATVTLYKCTEPGSFGCRTETIVDTEISDSAGNFQFDSRLNADKITASCKNYIDGSTGGIGSSFGSIVLMPLGHSKIHLVEVNPHPTGIILTLDPGIDPVPILYTPGFLYCPLAADTTIIIDSPGNINNTLVWLFSDSSHVVVTTETGGQVPEYYVNRFDTAFVELHY